MTKFSFKDLAYKILDDDFYFDTNYGSTITNITTDDLFDLSDDIFEALKKLQDSFDERIDELYKSFSFEHEFEYELVLAINPKKQIIITYIK